MAQQPVVPEGEIEEEEAEVADSNDAPLKDLVGAATERTATAATTSGSVNNGGGGDGGVRWYERAYDYWEDGNNCPLDDDGVLGGYGHISPTDIAGSGVFLDELQSMRPLLGDTHAAGRVSGENVALGLIVGSGRQSLGLVQSAAVYSLLSSRLLREVFGLLEIGHLASAVVVFIVGVQIVARVSAG